MHTYTHMHIHKHIYTYTHTEDNYNDVYFMQGKIGSGQMLKKMNLKAAFSIALMSARTVVNRVDEQNVNVGTLFTFLKVENLLPRNVFVSVELTSGSNMAVLNATIMRRVREKVEKTIRENANRGTSVNRTTPPPNSNLVGSHAPKGGDKEGGGKGGGKDENKDNAAHRAGGRRHAALFDGEGRFTSKRSSIAVVSISKQVKAAPHHQSLGNQKTMANQVSQTPSPVRRGSVMALKSMMDTAGECLCVYMSLGVSLGIFGG